MRALSLGKHISTHTPLAGRDYLDSNDYQRFRDFYSHAPRGARLPLLACPERLPVISTHTPLAGRDVVSGSPLHWQVDFYSHAPRGARPVDAGLDPVVSGFLLTRPSRGATH